MTTLGNTTRRGFTEHEHLDSVGLVHMNVRVYDPILGRFLASDPVADGLGRPGGFNRYAYVKNNPLTLIDPSGLSSKETKLPKHDAGQHGPLIEGTLVFGSGADRETTIAALGAVTISATRLFSGISVVSPFYGFGSGGATGGTGEYYRQYRGGPPAGGPDPAPGGGDKDARPKAGDENEPYHGECTFSASVQKRREAASARNALANSAALGADTAREVYISSRIIDGTISNRGLDGNLRTRAIDTASQRSAIGGSGLAGVAGRATLAFGVWSSGTQLLDGFEYGNREDLALGGLGAAALAVGLVNPALAIGMGIGILVGEIAYPIDHRGDGGSVIDALTNPCGPASRPAQ